MSLPSLPEFAHVFSWLRGVSPETANEVNRWISRFEQIGADKRVTLAEIRALINEAKDDLMRLMIFVKADGPLKKEAVLSIVGKLFDSIPRIPFPWYLTWLGWFEVKLRAELRQEVLEYVDRAIESAYAAFLKNPLLKIVDPNAA